MHHDHEEPEAGAADHAAGMAAALAALQALDALSLAHLDSNQRATLDAFIRQGRKFGIQVVLRAGGLPADTDPCAQLEALARAGATVHIRCGAEHPEPNPVIEAVGPPRPWQVWFPRAFA